MKLRKRKRLNRNIMKTNLKNDLVSRDDHLNKKYGEIGTPSREKYEE